MRKSGFFHVLQREHRDFLRTLVRMGIPADRRALDYPLQRMIDLRRRGRRYCLFLNLYDVHAPYSPSRSSPLRSFRTPAGWLENLQLPWVLPRISSHAYLRPGFRISECSRKMLVGRYHRAIELMDEKLADFYRSARTAGLLDDTLLVVTSDHGEAFGEHGLYFHDASVYNTHLHVPLWIHHPQLSPEEVSDVVSTSSLFALLYGVARNDLCHTILDPAWRASNPVALAEHFHYPYTDGLLPRFAQNLAAAIVGRRKVIARREGLEHYDLDADPHEKNPAEGSLLEFAQACRRDQMPPQAIALAVAHLRRWERLATAA